MADYKVTYLHEGAKEVQTFTSCSEYYKTCDFVCVWRDGECIWKQPIGQVISIEDVTAKAKPVVEAHVQPEVEAHVIPAAKPRKLRKAK